MSTINVAESAAILSNTNITSQEALTFIADIIDNIVPFDLEQAKLVADLHSSPKYKDLSFADCACIALGIKLQVPIYTAN